MPGGCTLINRPSVHTIYPPVAQVAFDAARLLSFGGHGGQGGYGGQGGVGETCGSCGGKGCGLCGGLGKLFGGHGGKCGACGGKGCHLCSSIKGKLFGLLHPHKGNIKYFVGPGGPVPLTPGYVPYVVTTRSPRDFLAFPPYTPDGF